MTMFERKVFVVIMGILTALLYTSVYLATISPIMLGDLYTFGFCSIVSTFIFFTNLKTLIDKSRRSDQ